MKNNFLDKKILCNLCNTEIVNDDLCLERMKRHTDFHKLALIQKRNTTHGIPKYLIISSQTKDCKKITLRRRA